jgi:hypothetical protein
MSGCVEPLETLSLDENKLLYELKISLNRFVKRIESFVFKGFNIDYKCVKSMIKKMVWHNSYTLKVGR